VYLDISYLPAERVRRKLPSMYDQFLELADVDITSGPMEVGPTMHYMMGGVRVEAETGATTRQGLYAAGEVAAGMHGANRLGGNSLSDLLVFGQRAGVGAAAFAAESSRLDDPDPVELSRADAELAAPFDRHTGENPYRIHAELQALMQSMVGIYRTGQDLEEAIDRLAELRSRAEGVCVQGGRAYNPGWDLTLELRNMLTCAEAVARSALQRTESRGAHSRIDHPDADADWGRRNSVVTRDGDRMRVTSSELPEIPAELRSLIKT
jgi:succinate dehydrogenase / fumarate reductase flavoprotein subunit